MVSGRTDTLMQTVAIHNVFSCTYASLIVLVLWYFDILYRIGKWSCWPLILAIVLAEGSKLCFPILMRGPKSNRDKHTNVKKNFMKNKFKSLLVIATMIVVFYVAAILFGAPLLDHHEETLMFSLLLTALSVLPSCLNLGADTTISVLTNLTTYHGNVFIETLKHSICLTLFGAWLGAVVVPLDWDRPWQVWPIPCSLGAIFGYICSHFIGFIGLVPKVAKIFVKKTGKYGL